MDLTVKIERMLNAFELGQAETDYRSVFVYRDGNDGRRQLTLGRGFTDDGGNLKKVIERYILRGGGESEFFAGRMDKFGRGILQDDKEFIKALQAVFTEPAMREAQDEVFKEAYLNPAFTWAARFGFLHALSAAVIADSYLHSGSVPMFLRKRFSEKPPSAGGIEKKWIGAYIAARHSWLSNHSNRILRNTVYRTRFFQEQINEGNWQLECPLRPNGVAIC